MLAALALLAACSGPEGTAGPSATPTSTPTERAPSPTPTPTATPSPVPEVTPTQPPPSAAALTGFSFPLAGACLPATGNLMPNAPRPYRAGVHEGVDFYPGLACAQVARGTPVLAAKDGVVTRADRGFVEMTAAELEEVLTRSLNQGYTDEPALDRFRGRQVWIDHGGGVVTRYAHLDGIAPGIDVGASVGAGEVVGYVGNSGTPQAVTAPDTEMHLHFEMRVGDSYAGKGLPADQVRTLYEQAFSAP